VAVDPADTAVMAVGVDPVTWRTAVLDAGARWSRVVVAVVAVGGPVLSALPPVAADPAVSVLVGLGLLAGLPHGAVDHRLAAALTGLPAPLVALAYGGAAVVTWGLLVLAGPLALVAVLALSVAHFGLGELEVVRATTGWRPDRAVAVAIGVAGTGALLLPLARAGDRLAAVAASISPDLGLLLASGTVRAAVGGTWLLAAVVAVAAAARAGRRAVVVDVLLVGALGLLAPPLVAFAVWFGGWHSLRHCARLLTVEPRSADLVADGRPRAAARALARLALWPTLAAVAALVALLVATAAADDPGQAVGGTLLVLLALTVPHMVVVLWLDRRG
jgi:Brp/Blh family beta-carotene 15,15'-monooxygenase